SSTTQSDTPVLAALQSTGQAVVIHDSADLSNCAKAESDSGMDAGENVWVDMRTADYINPDGTIGFVPAVVAAERHDQGDDSVLRTAVGIAGGEIQSAARLARRRMASPIRPTENLYPEMLSPSK